MPLKSFREILSVIEYAQYNALTQLTNIESRSTFIHILLKGEVAFFIPKIKRSLDARSSH